MSSSLLTNPLAEAVFPAHPRLDRYFASSVAEAARRRLTQCLLRGDGPALLLGAPGVGKTMLMNVLANDLGGRLQVVRLASTQLCTRRALLQAILHGLGAEFRNLEEGELRLSLGDLLADPSQTGQGVALLIDEAQSLPIRLLEELRLLSNLAIDGMPRVRLLLAGSNQLDEAFTAPELEAFSQRIAARCYLEPLNRSETAQYVRAHVAAIGDPDQLIGADAYDSIALASDGLPRLINQVADRALVLAAETDRTTLDAAAIGEAWSDLHQLAAPWQSPAGAKLAARGLPTECAEEDRPGIEFGMLDEDDALQAEAEAVSRMGREELGDEPAHDTKPSPGVWDAGDKLLTLPKRNGCSGESGCGGKCSSREASRDDEPVSYAFPILDAEEASDELESLSEAETAAKIEHFEEEVVQTLSKLPHSCDPFDEAFDEEEVVLDPFSIRERIIPRATEVIGSRMTDLEQAYRALGPAEPAKDLNEELDLLDEGTELDEADEAPVDHPAPIETVAVSTLDSDSEGILIVENDELTVAAPSVQRKDYAELFANLREG